MSSVDNNEKFTDSIDWLQSPARATTPDQRSAVCGVNSIEEQYCRIEPYQLGSHVPADILQHYEVARNLYLYAFYQYRFYMVAQHRLLVTLEYAISHCIGKMTIESFGKKRGLGKNLKACLVYISEKGLIRNEDFLVWNHKRNMDAQENYRLQKEAEMKEKGLDAIELDYEDADEV